MGVTFRQSGSTAQFVHGDTLTLRDHPTAAFPRWVARFRARRIARGREEEDVDTFQKRGDWHSFGIATKSDRTLLGALLALLLY